MNKREARRWVREHWAEYITQADVPGPPWPPEGVDEVWQDECRKIAARLTPKDADQASGPTTSQRGA